MAQYKTIAAPVGLTIQKDEGYADAVKQYADIINKEATGGWELLCVQEVPVVKNKGCLAAILALVGFGSAQEQITFNMLIFVKKD